MGGSQALRILFQLHRRRKHLPHCRRPFPLLLPQELCLHRLLCRASRRQTVDQTLDGPSTLLEQRPRHLHPQKPRHRMTIMTLTTTPPLRRLLRSLLRQAFLSRRRLLLVRRMTTTSPLTRPSTELPQLLQPVDLRLLLAAH